eukprot:28676-Pelagococcus_subviridis.AAC.9
MIHAHEVVGAAGGDEPAARGDGLALREMRVQGEGVIHGGGGGAALARGRRRRRRRGKAVDAVAEHEAFVRAGHDERHGVGAGGSAVRARGRVPHRRAY